MAFGTRFTASWTPIGTAAVAYALRIKEDGYASSSSAIDNLDVEPFSERQRAGKKEGDADIFTIGALLGTEIEFRFYITSEQGSTYDDLFTATERQFLIEVDRDGSRYFEGFMNPQNIQKQLIEDQYLVSISASCGLAYLSNVPFRDSSGDNYTDRVSGLTTLKRALEKTGHSLDFNIKLGTYEKDLMTSVQCALDKVTNNSNRFYRNNNGILEPDDCAKVISQVIGIYNCSIKQLDGAWYIYNNMEVNSFLFNFDWATLTQQSRTAHNPSVAIDNYFFINKGSVTARPPLSKLKITFENKFVPTNVVSNGDFASGTTDWTNGSAPNDWDTFSVVDEELNLAISTTALTNIKQFTSANISLTQVNSTDKLVLSLRAIVDVLTESMGGEPPFLKATIAGPSGSRDVDLGQASQEWKEHASLSPIGMVGTGNYTITIKVDEEDLDITALEMRIDDIEMYVDLGGPAATVDKLITISNDNAVDENILEYTTKIGDSIEENDEGSLKVGSTLTSSWRTYGKTSTLCPARGRLILNWPKTGA